jgi:agmatine/peptidylarginine deiminase
LLTSLGVAATVTSLAMRLIRCLEDKRQFCASCTLFHAHFLITFLKMIDNLQKISGLFPEWYPQSAVLIAWPDQYTDFSATLAAIETTYLEIVSAITRHQTVIIAVRNQQLKTHVITQLSTHQINPEQVIYVEIPYNDIWVRDIAPIAVQHNHSTNLLCLQFNAWGNQYSCQNDAKFAERFIASQVLPASSQTSTLTLEGGAIENNGQGVVLTTTSCIYDQRRNQIAKSAIQKQLQDVLHVEKLIALRHGQLSGDDTGGHIDTLARFCSADTIAYSSCDNPNDVHYHSLKQMYNELKQLRINHNTPYQLMPLPIPRAIFNNQGQRLPANYANFLIINNAVLVPQYGDTQDATSINNLAKCFSDRSIIPIDSQSLITQFGSLHCMTMNYPQTLKPSHIQ